MKLILALIFLTWAAATNAQSIAVRSGEHDGFTRFTIEYPKREAWSLFRVPQGYSVSIAGAKPRYDLTDTFRRIDRSRVSHTSIADDTGDLVFTTSCDCYAMPFMLSNGLLVIDFKDGQAPANSPFERDANGKALATPLEKSASQDNHPRKQPVASQTQIPPTILSDAITNASRISNGIGPKDAIPTSTQFDQIKNELLWQLSKAAADGIAVAASPFKAPPLIKSKDPEKNMRFGSELGLVGDISNRPENQMTATGQDCIQDQLLDIGTWAGQADHSITSEFAPNTTGLVGEFDLPEPTAIARAVKFNLALGFGTEARHTLTAFKQSHPERAIWETLSHILDLELPPGDVFGGMEVCETNAAMWSLLSTSEIPSPNRVAISAVLRSFSALPVHLRRLLGPRLADRFLARNDTDTASAIRDAILRAPGAAGPSVQLMQADLAIATGQVELAGEILEPLSGASSMTGLKATAALLRSKVDMDEDVPQDLVTTAESLLHEARGGQNEAELIAALALGYAAQNRFKEAFELVAPQGPEASQIWKVLADRGTSDAVLHWAIVGTDTRPPPVASTTAKNIAQRLSELGFPDAALIWLEQALENANPPSEDLLLLAAEIERSANRLPQALSRLNGLTSEPSEETRAKVLAAMRANNAAEYLDTAGQPADATHAEKQTPNWSELSHLNSGELWNEAIALTAPYEKTNAFADEASLNGLGPLAHTRAVLAETVKARTILDKLLATQ